MVDMAGVLAYGCLALACLCVAVRTEGYQCQIQHGLEANTEDEACETYWDCHDYVGVAKTCPDGGQFDFQWKQCRSEPEVWCQWQHQQLEKKRQSKGKHTMTEHVHHYGNEKGATASSQQQGSKNYVKHVTTDKQGNTHIHLIPIGSDHRTDTAPGHYVDYYYAGQEIGSKDNVDKGPPEYYYYEDGHSGGKSSDEKGDDFSYNHDDHDSGSHDNDNSRHDSSDTSSSHEKEYYDHDNDDVSHHHDNDDDDDSDDHDDESHHHGNGDYDKHEEEEEEDSGFYDDMDNWPYVCESKFGHEPNTDDPHCRSFWRCDYYKGSMVDCKPGYQYDYEAKACRPGHRVHCEVQHHRHISTKPKHKVTVEKKKDGGLTIVHHYHHS